MNPNQQKDYSLKWVKIYEEKDVCCELDQNNLKDFTIEGKKTNLKFEKSLDMSYYKDLSA